MTTEKTFDALSTVVLQVLDDEELWAVVEGLDEEPLAISLYCALVAK